MNDVLRRYKSVMTHFASDYGPGNLSAIQFDLQENIDQAEYEVNMSAPELNALNRLLRRRLDDLVNLPVTTDRNTDPVVRAIVGMMYDMAFKTETLHQVASHPLPALMIHWLAGLAGYAGHDPLETRWAEAKEKAENYIAALEEAEHA